MNEDKRRYVGETKFSCGFSWKIQTCSRL